MFTDPLDTWLLWYTVNFYTSNKSFSEGLPSYQVHSLISMLSCGTAVSATTHITRQKRLSCWNPFQPDQFPKWKISVQEHYSCAWTYQGWCHSSELQHRDHFSRQDSHEELMAIDRNALPWQQLLHKAIHHACVHCQHSKQWQAEY